MPIMSPIKDGAAPKEIAKGVKIGYCACRSKKATNKNKYSHIAVFTGRTSSSITCLYTCTSGWDRICLEKKEAFVYVHNSVGYNILYWCFVRGIMEGTMMDFLNFSSYDVDTWIAFFKEHWLVLVIALIVLFIIIRIVKTVVKWAIVIAIVLGLVVYSGYTMDDLKEIGTKVTDTVKQEAINAMVGEAKDATFTMNDDGTFTVKTNNVELTGEPGKNEVSIKFRGAPIGKWELDSTIQAFIDQAKQNG
ncbi:hypothetical protein D3C80_1402090 [compost metagenome]